MRELLRLLKNPLSMVGLLIVLGFVFVALAAPWLAPPPEGHRNPYKIPQDGRLATPSPPSPKHPLGTTAYQHDILYGLIWGARTAFRVGLTVTIAMALIGVVLGAISGFYGGWVDELLMRVTEIFLAFPFLVAAIVLTAVLTPVMGKTLETVIIALIVFGWPTYARLIRGDILALKEREYVQAARALGASDLRLIFRHILPNAIYPVLVLASLDMGATVLTAAALSFLGLGSERGYADWGQMISFARNFITELDDYWWTVVYPGAAIVLFVLGWNLLGDALRDIFDPRLRGTRA